MDFKSEARSNIIWSICQQFGLKIFNLVIILVLARLLSPAQFGLVAMLSVFIAIGNSLMDGGLTSSLIRTNEANQSDYSTIFIFNLIGSIVVYLILYYYAPMIASFYKQPQLSSLVRVYSVAIIINAFFSIQSTLLIKELRFKLQTFIQLPAIIVSGAIGIVLAKLQYGVWSLVWMSLSNAMISTLLHWYCSSWRPKLMFNKACFKKHFEFGYKMTASSLLDTLHQNIYVIIIGRFYSAAQLGFYSRAETLSQFPIMVFSTAISKVTYPMFALISNDDEKLKRVYKQLLKQIIFWNAPILIYLAVIAKPLILFLLTDKWLEAVFYFQILCIAGIMYPLHAYNLNILKVKGQSGQFLQLEIIKKVISIAGIACVIPFGIPGILYYQLLFNVFAYYINSKFSGRLINYSMKEQVLDILPILLLAAGVGITCFFFDNWLINQFLLSNIYRIAYVGILYSCLYLGISSLLRFAAIDEFKQLIVKL